MSAQRAVLISGASTGIGFATAKMIAEAGLVVFAGVRNDEAAARVAAVHPSIRPVRLDVTDAASIAAAAQEVDNADVTLVGLVNNAGIAIAGPLECVRPAQLREQFEVNVIGPIALTQAFLPRLRRDRGRIVFVGSISGRFAVPFIAPYSSSKFALRALSNALRVELAPSGIEVSLIEPGSVKTPIWQKGRATHQRQWGSYADAMEAVRRTAELEERNGIAPERVGDAILHALLDARPRAHYLVGTPARIGSLVFTLLPARLHDRLIRKSMRLP